MNIDWEKAADGTATALAQCNYTGVCFWINNIGQVWSEYSPKSWTTWEHNYKIIVNRPKPPLTQEQMEAVREFARWDDEHRTTADTRVGKWLEERSND